MPIEDSIPHHQLNHLICPFADFVVDVTIEQEVYLLPRNADKLDMYSCSGWHDTGVQYSTVSLGSFGRETDRIYIFLLFSVICLYYVM